MDQHIQRYFLVEKGIKIKTLTLWSYYLNSWQCILTQIREQLSFFSLNPSCSLCTQLRVSLKAGVLVPAPQSCSRGTFRHFSVLLQWTAAGGTRRDPAVTSPLVVYVLCTTAAVVSQAGWLTLRSNHIIPSLNRHTIGQDGSHDNYDRTSALFLLPVWVCVF